MNNTVLIIEDETDLIEILRYNFEREGFRVLSATHGEAGLDLARDEQPSVVLLDIMLPGLDGIEVAKRLRSNPQTRHISIIMLTAKGEETDVVLGLGVGADDYVTKPFRMKEVLARVKAVARRGPVHGEDPAGVRIERGGGELKIDTTRYTVELGGEEVRFTLTEFKILAALAAAPGAVFSRAMLLTKAQGDTFIDERNIDVHVKSIRKKLGSRADWIVTVRGVGYKFKEGK